MSFKITAIKNIVPNICYFHDDIPYDKNENLITYDEAKVNAEITRLQKEWDAQAYSRNRQQNYPNTDDLIVALWEKVMEGRSQSADALEVKRQEVKTAHPKPE